MKNGPAYSHEEKIAIIREHEEGHKTLRQVCEKYGISKSYLCYLLKHYRAEGEKGIADTRYDDTKARQAQKRNAQIRCRKDKAVGNGE